MKALVLGGSGFVGAAVAERLEGVGAEVTCLSRRRPPPHGRAVVGDVSMRGFGLRGDALDELRDGLTHIFSCFGSVDWKLGPRGAMEVHGQGMRSVIRFAEECPGLERLVHLSSVLVLGRAKGRVGNRELDVGQGFRSWYEYGKFVAEKTLRDEGGSVPWRAVRVGPVLGTSSPVPVGADDGMPALLPSLLRGYPLHLDGGGDFASYAGEVGPVADVLVAAATTDGGGSTWTWYDPERPSMAETLTRLCAPWGVVPRIVDVPPLRTAARAVSKRLGIPRSIVSYGDRWVEIDPGVLGELPIPPPECAPDYVEATGVAIRDRRRQSALELRPEVLAA